MYKHSTKSSRYSLLPMRFVVHLEYEFSLLWLSNLEQAYLLSILHVKAQDQVQIINSLLGFKTRTENN